MAKRSIDSGVRVSRWALAGVLAMLASAPAFAQETANSTSATDKAEQEAIIVTGSRLARSTFDTPSPVTVLGGADLERLAVVNVGQVVDLIPAFRPSTSPTTQGFGSFNVGARIANLRGLGVTRNLILVDGRRFAPTTREGSVDLNLIPALLIERTEVVTGGASAAYGSDAIAGVLNVILNKQFTGIKLQADVGISSHGDGRSFHVGGAYGADFAGGRGHIVIGGEYDDQKGIGNCFNRSWCKLGGVVQNTAYATNGQPNYVRSDDNAGWLISPSGVVSKFINRNATGLAVSNFFGTGAITFDANGNPVSAAAGSIAFGSGQIGGDLYASYTDANISVPVKRYTGFAHADYEFSDSIKGFIEGSYGHVDGTLLQTAYYSNSLPIYADNPYIPASLRTIAGLTRPAVPSPTVPTAAAFTFGRVLDDVGRAVSKSVADTYRFTGGLSGELGQGWAWDVYYQYGRTDRLQTVENNTIKNNLAYAMDAVVDPVSGNVICRGQLATASATTRAASAGCVPINLFGSGRVTTAAKNYIFGTLTEEIKLQQHVGAFNVRGDLVDLWAGPLSVATGGEYRTDKISVVHDALSNTYAYFQNFGTDYRGTSNVFEGYLEAELPLAKDVAFARNLSLNGAIRRTHYDIKGFGSYLLTNSTNKFWATSWKGSLSWEPVKGVRLRATQSRDIRAPNFAELFLSSANSFTTVINRFNTAQTASPLIYSGGSPFLRPEKADTTTVGMVLTPGGALQRLRVSVDFFNIKVKDYISTAPGGAQFIIDRCFAGVTAACAPITFGANNTITQITNVNLNLDYIKTRGVDFELDYRIPLGGSQQLMLRGVATYVDQFVSAAYGTSVDRAGQTGTSSGLAAPRWTANGSVTYSDDHLSLTAQARYVAPGSYDAQRIGPDSPGYATTLANSINNNRVEGRMYFNLFASVFVGEDRKFEFFGAVNNVFDRAPPAAPETQFYTNPVYFDTIGRYFRAGVRLKY